MTDPYALFGVAVAVAITAGVLVLLTGAGVVLLVLAAAVSPHPTAVTPLSAFRCPYCQGTTPPRAETRVTPLGWTLFGSLPLLMAPLGGLFRERWHVCTRCGLRFGRP